MVQNGLKIALAGNFYAGKSTLAQTLESTGWELLDISQSLKRMFVRMLNSQGIDISLDDLLTNKDKYRNALQELGRVIGWDEGLGIEMALQSWRANGSKTPVVLEPVRTTAQWALLEKEGFKLVRLIASSELMSKRAAKFSVNEERLKEIQGYLNSQLLPQQQGEIRLNADNTPQSLAKKIVALANLGVQ